MKTRGGQAVTTAVKEGLVRADGKYLYVVDDDIPVMLIDEAIPLQARSRRSASRAVDLQQRGRDLRGQLGGGRGSSWPAGQPMPEPSAALRLAG